MLALVLAVMFLLSQVWQENPRILAFGGLFILVHYGRAEGQKGKMDRGA